MFAALTIFAFPAAAEDCYDVCDPYNSSCSQPCERCLIMGWDGCISYGWSTCEDAAHACIPDECSPNWVETSRVNKGTYGGSSFMMCTHHVVDEVIVEDLNQCNISSYYWSYQYCEDWIDSYKNACCYPSCCSGLGDNGISLSCNGVHVCS